MEDSFYLDKYLKYKNKYLNLKEQNGGRRYNENDAKNANTEQSAINIVNINPELFKYLKKEFKNNEKVVLIAVKNYGGALEYAPEFKNKKEVVLEAVQNKYGDPLKYASPDLKKDKDVVLAAVSKNGIALKYASPGLQNDKDVVLAAVNKCGAAFEYTSPDLKKDIEIFLTSLYNLYVVNYAYKEEYKNRHKDLVNIFDKIYEKYSKSTELNNNNFLNYIKQSYSKHKYKIIDKFYNDQDDFFNKLNVFINKPINPSKEFMEYIKKNVTTENINTIAINRLKKSIDYLKNNTGFSSY